MKQLPSIDVCCAIIEHNERILAARKAEYNIDGGLWEFPGGKLENGETLENCIQREIDEELSIKVSILANLGPTYQPQNSRIIILHAFICSFGEETIIPGEHQEIRWILPGEFYGLDWLEADKQVWEKYRLFRNF